MLDQFMNYLLTRWVSPLLLQAFVKNPSAPCCVVVVARGVANNSQRRQGVHAGISHKSMFNCGF